LGRAGSLRLARATKLALAPPQEMMVATQLPSGDKAAV